MVMIDFGMNRLARKKNGYVSKLPLTVNLYTPAHRHHAIK